MGATNEFTDVPGIGGSHIITKAVDPNSGTTKRLYHKESLTNNEAGSSIDCPEQGSLKTKYLTQGNSYNWSGNFRLTDLADLQRWGNISSSANNYFNIANSFPVDFQQEYCHPEASESELRRGTAKVITTEYLRNCKADNKGNTNSTGAATMLTISGRCDEVRTFAGKVYHTAGTTSSTAHAGADSQFSSTYESSAIAYVRYKGAGTDYIDITDREGDDGVTADPSYEFLPYDDAEAIGAKGCVIFHGLDIGSTVIIGTAVQSAL